MPTFTARIERQGEGFVLSHYVAVPDDVAALMLASGHRRLLVSVGGRAYRRGLVSSKANGETIVMGKDALQFWGLRPGDTAAWTVEPDPEPDNLEIPDELTEWLSFDDEARTEWEKLTPGVQRSLAYYIRTGKRYETRIARVEEMMRRIKAGELETQKAAKRRAAKGVAGQAEEE